MPYSLYNADKFCYELESKTGLYGSIPLVISHNPEVSNQTVAVFWRNPSFTYFDLNKNIDKQNSSFLYASQSGDMDFIVIMGDNLNSIFYKLGFFLFSIIAFFITNYIGLVIGFTILPPYYGLGIIYFNNFKNKMLCLLRISMV